MGKIQTFVLALQQFGNAMSNRGNTVQRGVRLSRHKHSCSNSRVWDLEGVHSKSAVKEGCCSYACAHVKNSLAAVGFSVVENILCNTFSIKHWLLLWALPFCKPSMSVSLSLTHTRHKKMTSFLIIQYIWPDTVEPTHLHTLTCVHLNPVVLIGYIFPKIEASVYVTGAQRTWGWKPQTTPETPEQHFHAMAQLVVLTASFKRKSKLKHEEEDLFPSAVWFNMQHVL